MSPAPAIPSRRGFTLIELLVVISVILILATMMLGIRAANPEGLANGQRMVADMLRIARVQATMNRAAIPMPAGYPLSATNKWAPANFRYRLLIKCDPADPDAHLREMVIAIGFTGIGSTTAAKYCWFSPEPPVRLPPGVFFVPPNLAVANGMTGSPIPSVTMPSNTSLSGTSVATRYSRIPGLADLAPVGATALVNGTYEYCTPGTTTQAPMMLYRPTYSAAINNATSGIVTFDTSGVHSVANGGRYWYYVELGADGTNNHLGKAVLVVAGGVNTGASVVLTSPDKFAAVMVRRNGDVSMTSDTDELEATGNLLK